MSLPRLSIVAAFVLSLAAPAAAQSVRLEFHNGRVTLSAQNAPIRTVLSEWARVGGTKIVNGERVSGAPLTLELSNVPERQALDIILRSVSGYMAGPREAGSFGASSFDRIMILPTSAAAAAPRPGAPAPTPVFTPPQPAFPPQFDPNDPEENPPNDVPPDDGPIRGRPFRRVPPGGVQGGVQTQPFPPQTQPDPEDEPEQAPPASASPFGTVTGSSRPGVITPVPQQPRPNNRPNGDPEP